MSLKRVKSFVRKGELLLEEAKLDLEAGCFDKAVSAAYFSVEAYANVLLFIKRQKVRGFRSRVSVVKNLLGEEFGVVMEDLHLERVKADHYEVVMGREDAEKAIFIAEKLIHKLRECIKKIEPSVLE